jgi:hypothetical protein
MKRWDADEMKTEIKNIYIPLCIMAFFSTYYVMQYVYVKNIHIHDDAYYYLKISNNIISYGKSSFDLISNTNGYHPLWIITLSILGFILKLNELSVRLVEIGFLSISIYLLIKAYNISTLSNKLLLVFTHLPVLTQTALGGMEIALLFCAFSFLQYCYFAKDIGTERTVCIALASCLCIGARIDSAFFVIPIIILNNDKNINNKIVISILILSGIAYSFFNYYYFNSIIPISALIKSIGGLQFNYHYFENIYNFGNVWKLGHGLIKP